jgi:hypothetical protein
VAKPREPIEGADVIKDAPTSTPVFFRLALHRRRRLLDLDPVLRSAGAVCRAEALRHNALAAEPAGLLIDDLAVADVAVVEGDTRMRTAQ